MFPYLFLTLGTVMFYWWPLGLLSCPLWFAFAILFVIGTVLNITSHQVRAWTANTAKPHDIHETPFAPFAGQRPSRPFVTFVIQGPTRRHDQ